MLLVVVLAVLTPLGSNDGGSSSQTEPIAAAIPN